MVYLLYIIFIIALVILVIKRIRVFKTGLNLNAFDGLFFGGLFYMILPLVYYVFINENMASDEAPPFDPWYKDIETSLYIFFSIFLFGICSLLFSKRKIKEKTSNEKVSNNEKFLFLIIFVLYFISQIIFLFKSGKLDGDSHWYHANQQVFESSVIYTFIGQFNNVGRLLLPAICMYFELKYKSKATLKLHIIISLLIIPIELLLTGNRIAILYVGISHLIPFIYQKKYKYIIYAALFVVPFYLIASLWPVVRGLIWTERISTEHIANIYDAVKQTRRDEHHDPIMSFTEGYNLFIMNYIYNKYPTTYGHTYGETMIIKSAGTLIPKKIWPDKPDGVGRSIGKQLMPQVEGLVLNPSVIGETYVNFGWFGNFLLLLLVYVISKIKFKFISLQLYGYIMFFASIAVWRFDTSFFFIVLYTLLIYILLIHIGIIRFLLAKINNILKINIQ